jgi:hypothetical protein
VRIQPRVAFRTARSSGEALIPRDLLDISPLQSKSSQSSLTKAVEQSHYTRIFFHAGFHDPCRYSEAMQSTLGNRFKRSFSQGLQLCEPPPKGDRVGSGINPEFAIHAHARLSRVVTGIGPLLQSSERSELLQVLLFKAGDPSGSLRETPFSRSWAVFCQHQVESTKRPSQGV